MAVKEYGWQRKNSKFYAGKPYDITDGTNESGKAADQAYDPNSANATSSDASSCYDAIDYTWFYEMTINGSIFLPGYAQGSCGSLISNQGQMSQYGSALLADPTNNGNTICGNPDNPDEITPMDWMEILHFYYDYPSGTQITIDNRATNAPNDCVGCPTSGGSPPTMIQAIQVSNGVSLTWNQPGNNMMNQDVTTWILYKRLSTTSDISKAAPFASVEASYGGNVTFTDLVTNNSSLPNATYFYSIAGVNEIGEGPNSFEVNAVMPVVENYTLSGRNFIGPIGNISASGNMTIQNDFFYNGSSIAIHGNPVNILPTT